MQEALWITKLKFLKIGGPPYSSKHGQHCLFGWTCCVPTIKWSYASQNQVPDIDGKHKRYYNVNTKIIGVIQSIFKERHKWKKVGGILAHVQATRPINVTRVNDHARKC